MMKKLLAACTLAAALFGAAPVWAEEVASAPVASEAVAAPAVADASATVAAPAASEAAAAAAPAPVLSKADNGWIMVCAALVILMSIPGLAMFYGGLVRSKNMLSVLAQVLAVFALISVLWVLYGYSLAFTSSNAVIGGLSKALLAGVTPASLADTFTADVKISEFTFVAFQGAFAAITCALIVGAFAERVKFTAVLVFVALWFTFSYTPIAHMVWFTEGYLFKDGALDFAGGTVVHINAAVAGLVGAYFVGKRVGYGREAMTPHSLTMTMIGASLLWFGWFGFNAGSALEANGTAALAFVNTWVATAAATLSWLFAEWLLKGKPSLLGAASGAIAGLVVITPAAGLVGVGGALIMGLIGGIAGLWGVHSLKRMLNVDDSLDVFGVHGVCGIIGALLTGVFAAPSLGGMGAETFSIASQLKIQGLSVLITIVWSGVVSVVIFGILKATIGLRVKEDEEREGLDVTSHGEKAYNM
ncbi:ammonium transporter [Chitinilyticum litopenaei]|uniref:ammonium transporter n=1 Tax=Chitinilyticum litopenaei TaxID=1121276 RepID=UPI00040D2441|nr:ammonium transporter [Chitinilyticum litopenaei]